MEDALEWKMTLDGRQPWMEDNFGWNTTFDGRQPLMEDDHWWKMTFEGLLKGSMHSWKLKFGMFELI